MERVLFLGSKQLGLRCLETLAEIAPRQLIGAVTIDDRGDARTAYDAISEFCGTRSIPLHVATNRAHAESIVRETAPDLCLVSGWYWLVSKNILDVVPRGFIGVHFSALPKYRGGSPLVWALINGEAEVGISFFSFQEGVDAGSIWAQERIAVQEEDYIADVLARLEDATIRMLRTHWPGILSGSIRPAGQDHAQATYCAMRQPSDGEIDWRAPARDIYNFVRAQSHPYPGAFTWLEGEKLILWRVLPESAAYYGTPGQVARVGDTGVHVMCGDQRTIIVETVGWKGEARSAREVLKSVTIRLPSRGVSG